MSGFDPARFFAQHALRGHNALIGFRYVAHGADWVEMALDPDPGLAMDAATGVMAFGPIFTMMDVATSTSVWVRQGHVSEQVTLDLRLDYLRASTPGRTIFGRGECYRITRQVAFVRGQAHDGDPADPVAHVVGTFMFLDPAPSA